MPTLKFVISEPDTRKAYQLEVDQSKVVGLIGKKIGDEFDGEIIGLSGYGLKITGGTDKDGFPMHPRVKGQGRKRVILIGPPGFHPKLKGQRKRKTVHGNTIAEDIVQVNVKVLKKGAKPLEQLIPTKPKVEKPEVKEEKVEKPKEEKKAKPEKLEVKEKPKEVKKTEEAKIKEEKVEGEEVKEK